MTQTELPPAQKSEVEITNELLGEFQSLLADIGLADNEIIKGSLELAFQLHESDRRTYEPYINHPLRVAIRVIRAGAIDERTIAAALLHDTVEDHEDDLEQIAIDAELQPIDDRMPHLLARTALALHADEDTASIVAEVSHTQDEPYEVYLDRVANHTSLQAFIGKINDVLDNATPPEPGYGEEDAQKRRHVDEKQRPVYQTLIDAAPRLDRLVTKEKRETVQSDLEKAQTAALERLNTHQG